MARLLALGRVTSAQTKLARHHKMSAIGGLLLPLLAPMLVEVLYYPLWLAVLYGFFGTLMSALNFWFCYHIRTTDFMSLPVTEAATAAAGIIQWQSRLMLLGVLICIPIIASMFLLLAPEVQAAMGGLVIGLAVGLPIGLAKYFKGRAMARQLKSEVHNAALED